MMAMAQYATMNDLFFAIDPEGWANVMVMKNQVGGLISAWNGLAPVQWDLTINPDIVNKDLIDYFKWGK